MEGPRNQPKKPGNLFLIPTPLGQGEDLGRVMPEYNLQIIRKVDIFIVEQIRTARRFLKKAGHPKPIDELEFFELNKFTGEHEHSSFLEPARNGRPTGLLSEAGAPCVADPGVAIVSLAHKMGIPVVPLAGPSSIVLALMASGLNGQRFCFHGYLPVEGAALGKKIREMEVRSQRNDETQIFIETPYRNRKMLDALLKFCKPQTLLCVATDISLTTESIETKIVAQWKQRVPDFHKKPTVFLLYSR